MASPSKFQLGAIAGAIVLIVLLYFAPRKGDTNAKKAEEADSGGFSIEKYIDSLKIILPPSELQSIVNQEQMLKAARNPEQKAGALDSLSKLWTANRQIALAGFYFEQKARVSAKSSDWTNAGNKYYGASKFGNESLKAMWMDKAIESYSKVTELEPDNLDAKVSLGVCYVEGTRDPMKGIGLLREVVQRDSTNINAQLNLGMFAVQSGQYDKAIDRFNKILVMHPDYIEAYLYLGQTYAAKGEKGKAIEILEKYKGLNKDETINAEVQGYINELKNS